MATSSTSREAAVSRHGVNADGPTRWWMSAGRRPGQQTGWCLRPVILAAAFVLMTAVPLAAEEDASAWDVQQKVDRLIKRMGEEGSEDVLHNLELLLASTDKTYGTYSPEALHAAEVLARVHVAVGNADRSLPFWGRLLEAVDAPRIRVAYAEALLATGDTNARSGGAKGREVYPYMLDAIDISKPLEGDVRKSLTPALRVRLGLAVAGALYWQNRIEAARARLDETDLAGAPASLLRTHHLLLADLCYRLRDYPAAARSWTAAGHDRGAATAWTAARDSKQAMAIYVSLLETSPEDEGLLADAIRSARFAGGAPELLAWVEGRLAAAEGAAQAPWLRAKAQLHEILTQPEEARATWLRAAEAAPEDATAHYQLGRLALLSERTRGAVARADALTAFLAALERDPEHARARIGLNHIAGLDYADMWRNAAQGPAFKRAAAALEALVRLAPDDAMHHANLGNTLRVGGRHEQALAAYARAREENPYDPAILSDQGLALSGAGQAEAGLAAQEASVELDSEHLAGRQNAARVHWRAGRDEAAAKHLSAGVEIARLNDNHPMTYRFLLDRTWRTRRQEARR